MLWVALGMIVVIGLFLIGMYNTLIGRANQVRNIFGTLDAMLKKRWDLIPNLVATVQGYMRHEKGLFENLTALRSRSEQNLSPGEKVDMDNQLTRAISQFRMTVENYPQLKASENVLHLQRTLNEIEEQISAARRAFNAAVTDYNNSVEMFPTRIMASMIKLQRKSLFEIADAERQTPSISMTK